MSRNRFVVPEVKRIPLSEDEWIEVKSELNAGEQRRQIALAYTPVALPDGRVVDRRDLSQYELMRVHLWLTAWHIHDAAGNVPPLSLDAIRALDVETFEEINDKIYEHIVSVEMLTAEKKRMREKSSSAEVMSMS